MSSPGFFGSTDPADSSRDSLRRRHLHAVEDLPPPGAPDGAAASTAALVAVPEREQLPAALPAPEVQAPVPVEHLTIRRLALYAFEVLEGARSVAQLSTWVTPEVAQHLAQRRAARIERRTLYKDHRRVVATPGPAHLNYPVPGVIEATVILHSEVRATAVALRFEYSTGSERWRATSLAVL